MKAETLTLWTFTHVLEKFLKTKSCFIEPGMPEPGSNWPLRFFQKNNLFISYFWFVFWNSATVSSLLMCNFLHLLHLLNRFPAVHQNPQSCILSIIFESCVFLFKLSVVEVINVSRQKVWHISCFLLFEISQIYQKSELLFTNIVKGSDHLGFSWGGLGRFLGSQWDRQLKFSANASFLISWSLSKFELI